MDTSRTYVKILEEPAAKALRFRYECEGRSAGSLPGAKSTNEKKTFPKIQIVGPTTGRAVVVVSCVTFDPPYRPHPHNLVGKEGCKKGVCTLEIANEDMTCEFSNLGIQCVKKKDIEDSLKIREEIRVDPFRTGFSHKSQPGSIDLNSVRLCFQVFLEGPEHGQFKIPLKAVVSEPIYDKKAINDLTIMKLSECSSPVIGNREIILLCDKVSKDDIEIRFYEEAEADGSLVWESFADFQPSDVHKQYAICFRTPQYKDLEITSAVNVFIQLRCPSKDTTSHPRPFQYVPLSSGIRSNKRLWAAAMAASYDSALETSVSQPAEKRQNLEDLLGVEDAYKCLNDFIVSDSNALGEGGHVEYNAEEIEKIKKQLEGLGQEDEMEVDGMQSECQLNMVKVENLEPGAADGGQITMETNPVYSSFELAMKNPIEFNETIDKAFYNQLGPTELTLAPPPRPPKLKYEGEVNSPPPALPPRKKKPSGGGGLFSFFTGGKGKSKVSSSQPKPNATTLNDGRNTSTNENENVNVSGSVPPAAVVGVLDSQNNSVHNINLQEQVGTSTMSARNVFPEKKSDAPSYTNDNADKTGPNVNNVEGFDTDGSCVGIGEIYDMYVGDMPPKAAIEDFESSYGDVLNNN